ncbi:hypothetical protein GQ42DRAFT_162700 [Ramicandelaber brevisporus]|nr:hypothetical protein GQ42DRAFT_162700 [Ramicandelaber brevisporus]
MKPLFSALIVLILAALLALVGANAEPAASSPTLYKRAGNDAVRRFVQNWRQKRGRKDALNKLEGKTPKPNVAQKTVDKWIASLPNRSNAMSMANAHIDAKKVRDQKLAAKAAKGQGASPRVPKQKAKTI